MQKVYLLLRNNQQTGPHTLEELMALGVKPTDLIWVEGKSAAWRYPSEIKEFTPSAPADGVKKVQPAEEKNQPLPASEKKASIIKGKKIFVSLPFQPRKPMEEQPLSPEAQLEQKAEALRQRLQAYTPSTKNEKDGAQPETGYSRSLSEVEDHYAQWKIKQSNKKHHFDKRHAFAAFILAVVIGLPLYFFIPSKSKVAPDATSITETATENKMQADEAVNTDHQYPQITEEDNEVEEDVIAKKEANQPAVSKPVMNTQPVVQATNKSIAQTESFGDTDSTPQEAATETDKGETATAKKKTLGEAIDGFFGKFKKDKKEEPENTGTSANNDGVRRSSKRNQAETATPPPAPEALAQQVKITATEPADNWMLGIKGLKLTLHNQSDFKLSNAAVEVAYFDEQNTLLEKKTVLFKNVPANKTATLAAPDHRLASYAKHQLLTVSGE